MNPEAIADQIETQIKAFVEGDDFQIVSRAVTHWKTLFEQGKPGEPIKMSVYFVGQRLPTEFEILVKTKK